MFKTPKSADIVDNAITGVALGSGAMVSRGAISLVPEDHKTLGQFGIAGASFVGAASVKGKTKTANTLRLFLMGMGVMQTIDLISDQAAKVITPKADAGAIENFGYSALGLKGSCGGGCGMGNPVPYNNYPALRQPVITSEFVAEYAENNGSDQAFMG